MYGYYYFAFKFTVEYFNNFPTNSTWNIMGSEFILISHIINYTSGNALVA